jgi:hypothetical protein
MRQHGLGAQAVEVQPRQAYELGPFVVRFVPSRHSKLILGRRVPFDGELTCDHLDGLWPGAYRCGQVWGIRIAVAGTSLYHQGSADLDDHSVFKTFDSSSGRRPEISCMRCRSRDHAVTFPVRAKSQQEKFETSLGISDSLN